MKRGLFVLICICSFSALYAQTPSWLWAKSAGGADVEIGYAIAVDAKGNSYVAGTYQSASISFGNITLTNASFNNYDAFLVKYDAQGNVVWAKTAGGSGSDNYTGVALDNNGNVYVSGGFNSASLTLGSTTLTGAGNADVLLIKYDTAGNLLWAKRAGGIGYEYAAGVGTDAAGNCYIAGPFLGTASVFGSTTLSTTGNTDPFIAKYDASGNVLWAKSAGGTDADASYAIAVDAGGNSYVTGYFNSASITFGSTTLNNTIGNGTADVFTAKYDASGNVVWAKAAGGFMGDEARGVAIDGKGNCLITGNYRSTSLTFGSTTLTNGGGTCINGCPDLFVAKYDAAGNEIWARGIGGSKGDAGYSIAADAHGNSYVFGTFESSSVTVGSKTIANTGIENLLVIKYDTAGNMHWAQSAGIAGNRGGEEANGIAVDANGSCYVTGDFLDNATIDFGGIILNKNGGNTTPSDLFTARLDSGCTPYILVITQTGTTLTAATGYSSYQWYKDGNIINGATSQSYTPTQGGSYYVVVVNSNGCNGQSNAINYTVGISTLINKKEIAVYPNPVTDMLQLKAGEKLGRVVIYDMMGNKVLEKETVEKQLSIDMRQLPAGLYMIKTEAGQAKISKY